MHEQTHQAIYTENGIDSHVVYLWSGGETFADTNKGIPTYVMQEQGVVEAFGYQIILPTIFIIFTLVACTMYLGWRIDANKK